jgi:hypothetical protein
MVRVAPPDMHGRVQSAAQPASDAGADSEDTLISLLFRLWAIRKLWGMIRGNRNNSSRYRQTP